jgi:hypothetical protein
VVPLKVNVVVPPLLVSAELPPCPVAIVEPPEVVPSDVLDFESSEQAVTATLTKHVSTMEAHVVRKDLRKFMVYLSEDISVRQDDCRQYRLVSDLHSIGE